MIDTDEGGTYVVQMLAQILSAGMQVWSTWAFGGNISYPNHKIPPKVHVYLDAEMSLFYFQESQT